MRSATSRLPGRSGSRLLPLAKRKSELQRICEDNMHRINPLNRRCFLRSVAAAVAGAHYAVAEQPTSPPSDKGYPLVVPGYFGSQPGVQLGTQLPSTASDEDMRF